MCRVALVLAVALSLVGWAASTAGAKATVAPADRAAIDRTLDVFVPAAVGRRDSRRAWPLATAAMRRGSDRASWARGTMPVTPFPVIGTSFHGWTVDRVTKNRADIVLLVHLKTGAPIGAVSLDIAIRKVRGRWLVDSVAPGATFAAPGSDSKILAQPDFAPGGGDAYSKTSFSRTGRISAKWVLIIPGILLGVIVLAPILIIGTHRIGDRRVRRERSESDRRRVFKDLPDRPQ